MERLNATRMTITTDTKAEDITRELLRRNLFSIELISKAVNKEILSLFYSPGVGDVCVEITKNLKLADTLTLKGRSIAIVTTGAIFEAPGKQFMPVMDWLICQIKYFAGVDAFPFVIDEKANLEEVLNDLSTCYSGALYFDNKKIEKCP